MEYGLATGGDLKRSRSSMYDEQRSLYEPRAVDAQLVFVAFSVCTEYGVRSTSSYLPRYLPRYAIVCLVCLVCLSAADSEVRDKGASNSLVVVVGLVLRYLVRMLVVPRLAPEGVIPTS